MKRNVFNLIVFVLFLNVVTGYAQSEVFNGQLAAVVGKLDQAQSADDYKNIKSLLERLNIQSPDEWLPVYYLAYADLQLFFREGDETRKEQLLVEAGKYMDSLKGKKDLSKEMLSEIATLRGFLLYARMSVNPQVNGPKYTGSLMAAYGEALKLNPENPRAIALNACFQQNLASFTGGNYDSLTADLEKAVQLHMQKDKADIYPHWFISF